MARTALAASVPTGPALPFHGKAPAPKPAAGDLPPVPGGSLHRTTEVGQQSPIAGKALPFEGGGGALPKGKPFAGDVTRTALIDQDALEPGAEPTERLRIDEHVPAGDAPPDDAATRVATAVSAGQPGRSSTMTLEDYAVLSAEASVFPERIAAIRQKYGVATEEAHQEIDGRWQARFAREPDLRAQFDELVAGFAAFLQRDKR
ncbi:MAG: hypothetical protein JRI23_12710 [Deltaproteobacteria bacterium]|jgi:hypothetical protein|nr:hypothetical protein [Deltaproteobacteria bacterium]MBW2532576.1 hypothetical protein [Deltaproteobacteria bacterium]